MKRMLVNATQPEEVRIAITDGNDLFVIKLLKYVSTAEMDMLSPLCLYTILHRVFVWNLQTFAQVLLSFFLSRFYQSEYSA